MKQNFVTGVFLGSLVLGFGGGCPQDPASTFQDVSHPTSLNQQVDSLDPISFIVIHLDKFEKIIREHPTDCEETLYRLLRFIDENKNSFLSTIIRPPNDWSADVPLQQQSIQLIMEFSDRCPSQVARLNQAILALVK